MPLNLQKNVIQANETKVEITGHDAQKHVRQKTNTSCDANYIQRNVNY